MGNEIKELQQALDFTRGHLDAVERMLALFIAASPDPADFLKDSADELLDKYKSLSRNRLLAGAYRDGFGAAVDAIVQSATQKNPDS